MVGVYLTTMTAVAMCHLGGGGEVRIFLPLVPTHFSIPTSAVVSLRAIEIDVRGP